MSLSREQKALIGDKCVADELFSTTYLIRVPYSAAIPKEELLTFGLTGFYDKKELSRELQNPIVVRSTLPAIAEMIELGHQISLVDGDDSIPMYNVLRQHLANWKQVINEHGSMASPPFRDLILLDSVAAMLYDNLPDNKLTERQLTSRDVMSGFSLASLFGVVESPPDKPRQAYESYSPFFIEQQFRIEDFVASRRSPYAR